VINSPEVILAWKITSKSWAQKANYC
jgi:hypothetical protein